MSDSSFDKEIGYALPAPSRFTEDNNDLRFPQSSHVYTKMLREDAAVNEVYKAITLNILGATWRLDPNGADKDIVEHIASDLRLDIIGEDGISRPAKWGKVSWKQHLQKVLLAPFYGHMFFEQVYAVGDDGLEHLVKLAPRMPLTLQSIDVDDDGGLKGITQRPQGFNNNHRDGVFIPIDRLVAYVYEPRDTDWVGNSVLRATYKHWVIRDELIRLELTALDRNSMGVPIYTGSGVAEDPKKDLEAGSALATNIRSGDNSGGAIPYGASLEFKGINGQIQSPQNAIKYHEDMIKKASLAHFMNLSGEGGSYSLASEQSNLFYQSLQGMSDWIADTATQYIIQDLIEIAYPDYKGSIPRILCEPITRIQNLSAQEFSVLVQNGVIIMDSVLEEHVRRQFNLPTKKPFSEALIDKALAEEEARKKLEKKGLELPSDVLNTGEEVENE